MIDRTCSISTHLYVFQITAFFSGNLEFLSKDVGFLTRGARMSSTSTKSHPVVNTFQQRAADYISMVNKVHTCRSVFANTMQFIIDH